MSASYRESLKHPMWQRKRLQVLERADFKCERCSASEHQLHAHHKVYLRGHQPWEYAQELLECLCDACHERAHAERERLELMIAKHPTAVVPRMTKILDRLGAALSAGDPTAGAHLMNEMQDELDVAQDLLRGEGRFA